MRIPSLFLTNPETQRQRFCKRSIALNNQSLATLGSFFYVTAMMITPPTPVKLQRMSFDPYALAIRTKNRFDGLNPDLDCTPPTPVLKPLQARSVQSNPADSDDPNTTWRSFSIRYHGYALNWSQEGESKTSEALAHKLTEYLQTLSCSSAKRLSSIHCKEILVSALILTDKRPLNTCTDLKLHTYLDATDLASIMALAIELNESHFLELLGDQTQAFENDESYNNGLCYTLSHCKWACLNVLLKCIPPHHTSAYQQSRLQIDTKCMLDTLLSERQNYRPTNSASNLNTSDAFINCLALLIDLTQALEPFSKNEALRPLGALQAPVCTNQLYTNAEALSWLLNHKLSKRDQKAILALFLDKGWLSASFCKEHYLMKDLFQELQDLRRSKHTKKALRDA